MNYTITLFIDYYMDLFDFWDSADSKQLLLT